MSNEAVTISPDYYMGRPIDSLLWGASMLVRRVLRMAKMSPEAALDPEAKKIAEIDEQMRVAYLASIRLRAKEVCTYASTRGYRCDEQLVKEKPLGIALVLFPPMMEDEL